MATRAGENKALISYHFGSKSGLVREVAQVVADRITAEVLEAVADPADGEQLARRVSDALAKIPREDPGLARLYFDLAGWAAVEPEIKAIMAAMKERFQSTLRDQLARVDCDDPAARAVFMIACLEGFTLEQLERGETTELERARAIFVASVAS